MKKLKFIMFLIMTSLFEFIAILAAWFTFILEKYKVEGLTQDIIKKSYIYLLEHPLIAVKTLINSKNPGILIFSVLAIGFAIYLLWGLKSKDYKIESKYAVHGSARFATKSELIRKKQTIGVKPKEFMEDLLSSMGVENGKEKIHEK